MRHLLRRLSLRHLDDASQCSAGVGEVHGRLGKGTLSEESFPLPPLLFRFKDIHLYRIPADRRGTGEKVCDSA